MSVADEIVTRNFLEGYLNVRSIRRRTSREVTDKQLELLKWLGAEESELTGVRDSFQANKMIRLKNAEPLGDRHQRVARFYKIDPEGLTKEKLRQLIARRNPGYMNDQ